MNGRLLSPASRSSRRPLRTTKSKQHGGANTPVRSTHADRRHRRLEANIMATEASAVWRWWRRADIIVPGAVATVAYWPDQWVDGIKKKKKDQETRGEKTTRRGRESVAAVRAQTDRSK